MGRFWIELKKAFPEFNLVLISSWMSFSHKNIHSENFVS